MSKVITESGYINDGVKTVTSRTVDGEEYTKSGLYIPPDPTEHERALARIVVRNVCNHILANAKEWSTAEDIEQPFVYLSTLEEIIKELTGE